LEVAELRGQAACPIADESTVGAARRHAARLADAAGLSEAATGRLGIIVTELARNVGVHAGRGTLYLQRVLDGNDACVEVLAVDSGPGMADVDRCLSDGYSTGGTPGTGLGAVKRLSSAFDIYSHQGGGTVVLSRVRTDGAPGKTTISAGAISTCAPGETQCGDRWSLVRHNGDLALLVADGLGHGPAAAAAADRAAATFEERPFAPLSDYFDEAHRSMRGTRGAAVAVAQFTASSGALLYAGVGNISARVLDGDGRGHGLVSSNGTVGAHMRTVRAQSYEWPAGDLLLMYSDGLKTEWSLAPYPGLRARHPAVIGAVLHRDFQRGADDATIVVLRRGE
jgi:anti-sigma regulatory factor (Ser/Thr protein kinase)